METQQEKFGYKIAGGKEKILAAEDYLEKMSGVENTTCVGSILQITYDPYNVSKKDIISGMEKNGFTREMKQQKGLLSRWLDRLAKANHETFGDQQPDCCSLNHK